MRVFNAFLILRLRFICSMKVCAWMSDIYVGIFQILSVLHFWVCGLFKHESICSISEWKYFFQMNFIRQTLNDCYYTELVTRTCLIYVRRIPSWCYHKMDNWLEVVWCFSSKTFLKLKYHSFFSSKTCFKLNKSNVNKFGNMTALGHLQYQKYVEYTSCLQLQNDCKITETST